MNTNGLLGIVAIICAIWVLYDVWVVNKKLSGGAKLLWSIFALIFNIATAIVYYFTQKK